MPTGSSGLTDTELRASSVQVQQVSGYSDSVNVLSTVGLTDTQIRASSVPVEQVSGSIWSTNVVSSIDLTDTQLRAAALDVRQVSGSIDSVNVVTLPVSFNAGDADATTLRQISAKSANATTAAVSVGADASTNIALTNLNRKSIAIVHTSLSNLYIATGTAASTTSMPVVANQIVGFDDYIGPVNAIAEEQAGTISVRYIEIV